MSGFYLKILQNWIPFGGLSGHLWTGRFLSSLPKSPSQGMGSPTQPAHISIKITGLPSGAFGFWSDSRALETGLFLLYILIAVIAPTPNKAHEHEPN